MGRRTRHPDNLVAPQAPSTPAPHRGPTPADPEDEERRSTDDTMPPHGADRRGWGAEYLERATEGLDHLDNEQFE
eukprot:8332739-Alexandrium_andersonii.AAC.1